MKFWLCLLFAALLLAGSLEHPAHSSHGRTVSTRTIQLTLAFACIHSFEGSWTADTGNGYHGGLQMDAQFERAYGPELLRRKGHAENWTPAEQVGVAIRAFNAGRGYGPWPVTRKRCGL